jgi:mitochondrial fission protein ELM1
LTTQPLRALLFSDGKPGHHRQAEGVLAAIGRLRPVWAAQREVKRRLLVPTRTLLQFVNHGLSPAAILRIGYGVDAAALPRADLIVSAGGETLAANAAAARLFSAPNVFIGRLRRLERERVGVILVSLESLATHPNCLVCLPPSPIERKGRASGGGLERWGRTRPPHRVGVLIGGNSGTLRYSTADWHTLTQFLLAAHRSAAIRWLVTTSRRSGAAIAGSLAQLAGDAASGIEMFIDYRKPGRSSLAAIYGAADAILCTDDSTSMISEAVGACLPVVAVRPRAGRLEKREREYRELLATKGWYRALPLSGLTTEAFLAALEEIAPRTSSPLDELAAALRNRLPGLFAAADR